MRQEELALSDVEAVEAAWRVLSRVQSNTAQRATEAIVAFLEEIDDDGVVDNLNAHRNGKNLLAGIRASFPRRIRD